MERFEHIGDWWLPEAPENTVSGRLSFDPATGGTLELYRTLKGMLGTNRIDIIQGEIGEGSVTLQGSFFSSFGVQGTAMSVQYIYKGHLFDSIDDVKFKSISLTYTHLNEWFAHRLFDYQSEGDTFKFDNISYVPFEPFDTPLDDNIVLHFDFIPIGKLLSAEISFQYEARITIKPNEPLLWLNRKDGGYLRLINFHLPNFLILATGYINHPFHVSGTVEGSESPISIYYRTLDHLHNSPTVRSPSMFFTLRDVKDNLSKYLSNWINKSDKLMLVYDLYFRSYHQNVMIVESQFLDLAQALEGYHRRLHDGNRLSLRKRLKLICNDVLEEHTDIVTKLLGDPDVFISTVVDTRNYLTHVLEEVGKHTIRDDVEIMYKYVRKMQFLMRLCFLVELEFDPGEIHRLWNKDFEYIRFIDSVSER